MNMVLHHVATPPSHCSAARSLRTSGRWCWVLTFVVATALSVHEALGASVKRVTVKMDMKADAHGGIVFDAGSDFLRMGDKIVSARVQTTTWVCQQVSWAQTKRTKSYLFYSVTIIRTEPATCPVMPTLDNLVLAAGGAKRLSEINGRTVGAATVPEVDHGVCTIVCPRSGAKVTHREPFVTQTPNTSVGVLSIDVDRPVE